jgi:hypothetical protein
MTSTDRSFPVAGSRLTRAIERAGADGRAEKLHALSTALSDSARAAVHRFGVRVPIALLAASVLVNGLSMITPGVLRDVVQLSRDFGSSPVMRTYHGETPLFYAVAHLLGAVTIPRYLAFCALVTFAGFAVFWRLSRRALDSTDATLAFGLFVAHPITYVLQTWIGLGDSLAVACTAVLLVAANPLVLATAAGLGAATHPTVLLSGTALLLLRGASAPAHLARSAVAIGIAGLVVGRIGCALLPSLIGYEAGSRWQYVNDVSLGQWVIMNAANLPLVLYSLGLALWLPIVGLLVHSAEKRQRVFALYAAWLVCSYAIVFFTKDTSRVYALLTWAPTIHCLMHGWRLSALETTVRASVFRVALVLTAGFGWCVPHLWTGGGVIAAPWFFDLALQVGSLMRK